MLDRLDSIVEELANALPAADSLDEVQTLRHRYLGRRGALATAIGDVAIESLPLAEPEAGRRIKQARERAEQLVAERAAAVDSGLTGVDYDTTLPGLERSLDAGRVVGTRARAAEEERLLRSVRGAVEDVLAALRPEPEVVWEPEQVLPPWCASRAALRSVAGGETLGTLAAIDDRAASIVGRGLRLVSFELDIDAIGRISPAKPQFRPPTVFPGSWFDLSFEWPEADGYDKLASAIAVEHPLLVGRAFLSFFREPSGRASYTFRFWVESPERTLSSEEVEEVRREIVSAATRAGASLRSGA